MCECIFCKNWQFSGGVAGYSDATPGYSASMGCRKGQKLLEFEDCHDEDMFRAAIEIAQACPDYEQVS